jgi:hypothetical protein
MSTTTMAIPEDGDDEQSETSSNRETSSGPRKARHIPTREECLQGIAALTALIAMGLLTPARANAIRANFLAILRSHESGSSSGSARVADEDLLRLWRTQPGLIDLIQPLLTPEQLDLVMREVRRDAV